MAICKSCGFDGSPPEAHFCTRCFKLLAGPITAGMADGPVASMSSGAGPANASPASSSNRVRLLAYTLIAIAIAAGVFILLTRPHELQ